MRPPSDPRPAGRLPSGAASPDAVASGVTPPDATPCGVASSGAAPPAPASPAAPPSGPGPSAAVSAASAAHRPGSPAEEAAPASPDPLALVPRFSRAERWVHRTTALLMGLCVLSAAFLYVPQLAELVGRRRLVVTVHEWSGLLLPVPLLAGLGFRALRADLRLLNRFGPHDGEWLRAVRRRDLRPESRPAGKFNAGQKIYAAWIAGAVLVMLGTGLLMWFTHLAPLLWRTSATFVHDWLALAIGIVLAGHVGMALADPQARHGMHTGRVRREWAEREHRLWRP